jgi:hypothetical protein
MSPTSDPGGQPRKGLGGLLLTIVEAVFKRKKKRGSR